jgi:phosphate transport system permease protein
MNTPGHIEEIRALIRRHKLNDHIFALVGIVALAMALSVLVALFYDLLIDGLPRLTPEFFGNFPSRKPEQAGILSAWMGTLMVMIVTASVTIPLGVAAAVYLEEYAPKNWVTALIEINVTNLAGVPSIVYGLLALGLFVYALGFGESVLSAGLTLALLTLPVIIVATREAMRAVPSGIREGAYALGATRWQMVADHVVPYSSGGILTGIIIGLARAIGETAPIITIGALTFIAFLPPSPVQAEAPFVNAQWLMSEFTVLPIQMHSWVSRPEEAFQHNAAATGVVIICATLLMNSFAIYLRYRIRKNIKW